MIKNKDIFLKELANEADLQQNTISVVFASFPDIDISKREKFVENVAAFYHKLKDAERKPYNVELTEQEDLLEQFKDKDLRIKTVKLSSVRGYPKSAKPFGINLCNKEGKPESCVILGTNGSGKSSLYEAIEYTFCRRVGEAELRTFRELADNDRWFEQYLTHFNNGFADVRCVVDVNQPEFEPFNIHKDNIPAYIRSKVNPDSHFISDYDIYYMGRLDYETGDDRSFHNILAKNLGLTELLEFEKNLKTFIYYKRQTESRRITALEKENNSLNNAVDASKKSIIDKEIVIKQLKTSSGTVLNESKTTNELLSIMSNIKVNELDLDFNIDIFHSTINKFRTLYQEFISVSSSQKGQSELQFLAMGLELINETVNCPFCENSQDEKHHIEKNVKVRLKKIELANKAYQQLNAVLNELLEQLKNLITHVSYFRSNLSKEIKLIGDKSDLLRLLEIDNKLLNNISELTSNDYFADLQEIENSRNFLKNKFGYLFNFLNSNAKLIEVELPNHINGIKATINQREQAIVEVQNSLENKVSDRTISEQLISLERDINELKTRIESSEKTLSRNKKEIEKLHQEMILFNKIKQETEFYQTFLHNKLNKEVDKAFAPIKLIVEEILDQYLSELDDRDITIEISKKPDQIDEETGEVLSEIITAYVVPKGERSTPLPVKKYLNTFHYRLFTSMVGISIAIASRINTGINLPLVLDDIFYASDFKNRNTIQKFIKSLFEVFETYTPALPLQLIMFTHDELIFEGALNAVDKNINKNISFAKLFPHSDANEEEEYFNLIYKIPSYFPQKLFEKMM